MQGAVIRLPVDPRGVKYMWARFANCSRRGLQKKFQRWGEPCQRVAKQIANFGSQGRRDQGPGAGHVDDHGRH